MYPDYRHTEEEQMRIKSIIENFVENNDPVLYPDETNIERWIRENEERKAKLAIIKQNEKETNEALKGKSIDYVKMRDNTDQVLQDNFNHYGI